MLIINKGESKMKTQRNIDDVRDDYITNSNSNQPYSLFLKNLAKKHNEKINLIDNKINKLRRELKAYEANIKKRMLKEKLQKEKFINDIKIIYQEKDYKKEIKKFKGKYDFLDVVFDDSNVMSIVWVYLLDEYAKGTQFEDENYCDTFEQGYQRCIEIIEYMQMTHGVN
jgi:hypothetical protein|tara:strand:- start:44 stop:550 length:507 start_codon:yes stop_codon:yes gene_type:complete